MHLQSIHFIFVNIGQVSLSLSLPNSTQGKYYTTTNKAWTKVMHLTPTQVISARLGLVHMTGPFKPNKAHDNTLKYRHTGNGGVYKP